MSVRNRRGCPAVLSVEDTIEGSDEEPAVTNDRTLSDVSVLENSFHLPKLNIAVAEINSVNARRRSLMIDDSQSESNSPSDETSSAPCSPVLGRQSDEIHRRRRRRQQSRLLVSSSSSPARDEPSKRHKRNMILKALNRAQPDVATLRQLAISRGGLLDDALRQRAWPCLLDIDLSTIPDKPDVATLHGHRDYNQVVLDVNRSLKRFPPGMHDEVRLSYQDQLVDCIMWVLVSQPDLHYYQGFHDIVVTFLLVVGEESTFMIMDKLCQNHLRDFMEVTMEKTNYILHYLFPIINRANPKLHDFLVRSEVGTIFSLSWLLTWYGHVLSDFKHIVRLYDFFMACHPLMPIYLAANVVLYREHEVMQCECEMPYVHGLLSRIPQDLPFELLITQTGDLFIQYPPNVLEDEAQLQYEKSIEEIEKRREEGIARRVAASEASSRKQPNISSEMTVAHLQNRHPTRVIARITYWAVIGAFGAVAFATVLQNTSTRFDWPWSLNWWPV